MRSNKKILVRLVQRCMIAIAIPTAVISMMSSHGLSFETGAGWKKLWDFPIYPSLDHSDERFSDFVQGDSILNFSQDGKYYYREGKIFDFESQQELYSYLNSSSPSERKIFAEDFSAHKRRVAPQWLANTNDSYFPQFALNQPVLRSIEGRVESRLPANELFAFPDCIPKTFHVSGDANRMVAVESQRVIYAEWDPVSRKLRRQKSAVFRESVTRVSFVEGTSEVLLFTDDRVTDPFAFVWDTTGVIVERLPCQTDVTYEYDKVFDVSPDGHWIAMVDTAIDAPEARTTNIASKAREALFQGRLDGTVYLYDVVKRQMTKKVYPFGVTRVRFLTPNTLAVSYFNDPRKAKWRSAESGWTSSPLGNNGVQLLDIESGKIATAIIAEEKRTVNNIIAMYGSRESLILVKRKSDPDHVSIEAYSAAPNAHVIDQSSDKALENLAYFPLFHKLHAFYESEDPNGDQQYLRHVYLQRRTEAGTEWIREEKSSSKARESQVNNFQFPFPIFADQDLAPTPYLINQEEGYLRITNLTFKENGRQLFPLPAIEPTNWKYSFKVGPTYDFNLATLSSSRIGNEKIVAANSESRLDPKTNNLIVDTEFSSSSEGSGEVQTSMREVYQVGRGLVQFIDSAGRKYRLAACRNPKSNDMDHALERTIFSGMESFGNYRGNLLLAFYDFKNGNFKGSLTIVEKMAGGSTIGPFLFDGHYQGNNLDFSVKFDPKLPAKSFRGSFDDGVLSGTMDLIEGRTIHKQPFEATQIK